MDSLPPIPTPRAQRWREFRIQVLPIVIFLCVLGAIFLLWRSYVQPAGIVGMVETDSTHIASIVPGKLAGLTVKRFQRVKAGEVLGQVLTTDPKVLEASLGVIMAEINLIRSGMAPAIGQVRTDLDYYRLRLDFMKERVSQAAGRIDLAQAEENLKRVETLYTNGVIVAQRQFEDARALKDRLEAEIRERGPYLATFEKRLERAMPLVNAPDPVQAAIAVQEQHLKLTEAQMTPITLTCPVDGVISAVNHVSGENVVAGERILTISAPQADRIVGFIRQPMNISPKVGMPVRVRSRSSSHSGADATVLEVGNQLELIYTNLLGPSPQNRSEMGLPILVSLPPSLKLIPGEIVDLVLDTKPK